jgi:hypothetical protein
VVTGHRTIADRLLGVWESRMTGSRRGGILAEQPGTSVFAAHNMRRKVFQINDL